LANGNKEEGHYKNGKEHGDAILYKKDGTKYKLKYDNGKELERVLMK
jgi:antitoxin component YwqK of YwqJK toxin-antitoxin module